MAKDHPRIRGEHQVGVDLLEILPGSSPHTRGALDRIRRHLHDIGIIPAYAGSTRLACAHEQLRRDHPRIRGEHHRGASICTSASGSSPHTRGAQFPGGGGEGDLGIIPAYAGSTCRGATAGGSTRDHPRIRGEHKCGSREKTANPGSSPHTRGARADRFDGDGLCRIIPAYAGSTFRGVFGCAQVEDHPRIRGEH